jgi:hypothetical protein
MTTYEYDQPFFCPVTVPYFDENGNIQQQTFGHNSEVALTYEGTYETYITDPSYHAFFANLMAVLASLAMDELGGPQPVNPYNYPDGFGGGVVSWTYNGNG